METNRRDFIKKLSVAALGTGLIATGATAATGIATNVNFISRPKLPKVNVSSSRVIKETVGLRPFRKNGPRIEKQDLGDKTIVHNYGHGGSGWSLSWGTSLIASELVDQTQEKKIAVIGCGVIGLTTAITLQQKGYEVVIYTKDSYPNITSAMATGTWSPTSRLILPQHVTPEFASMYQKASTHSYRTFQRLLGINQVVEWMDNYSIHTGKVQRADYSNELMSKLGTPSFIYPKGVPLNRRENPFKFDNVSKNPTTIFNIPAYLKMMKSDFLIAGGKVEIKNFKSPEDIDALPQKCVVNCTGLGSQEIFGDNDLMPVSGQLCFLIPQPELTYRASMEGVYFIPRKDGIMIGGNGIDNNWDLTPDPAVKDKYLSGVEEMMKRLRS
ncbi:FAD-dependent oxidoreductase [Algoriphagus sp. NG3]|uniref:FAD-dependent oxidoreductase n=1 Tax=Algoriphagus sp. NG3 TaxID=3097546 RepID=UPI002A834801|nr:FAD-dependent oxidoreductase [Algoriphagus sp. NG3]WPR76215.1 FAD-dependent oxidoreductase [Algoriphagus sp. NG3]